MLKKDHKGINKMGFLGKIRRCLSRAETGSGFDQGKQYRVISHRRHCVSHRQISKNALTVLDRLKSAGYDAFLVGGGVRDLLLDRQPKDFDVVTNATPEQVHCLFRKSRIIGRRFRLVHVYCHREIIEVSTFRAGNADHGVQTLSMIKQDNTYGTIEEDAQRRDFTVNALFYDSNDRSIIDFTEGLSDIKARQIRMIGDPVRRFHEDPVRLLRAIRLAAKLDFEIHVVTKQAVGELGHLLQQVPEARLLDEMIKLFFEGNAVITFNYLKKMQYLAVLFPSLDALLQRESTGQVMRLIDVSLKATDERFYYQKPLTPGYLLAVFLWPVLTDRLQNMFEKGERLSIALPKAMHQTLKEQAKVLLITRRMLTMIEAMWTLQYHLEKRRKRRIYRVLEDRYFRAAFDLLELRAKAGEVSQETADWWEVFRSARIKDRAAMVDALQNGTT